MAAKWAKLPSPVSYLLNQCLELENDEVSLNAKISSQVDRGNILGTILLRKEKKIGK